MSENNSVLVILTQLFQCFCPCFAVAGCEFKSMECLQQDGSYVSGEFAFRSKEPSCLTYKYYSQLSYPVVVFNLKKCKIYFSLSSFFSDCCFELLRGGRGPRKVMLPLPLWGNLTWDKSKAFCLARGLGFHLQTFFMLVLTLEKQYRGYLFAFLLWHKKIKKDEVWLKGIMD